MEQTTLLLKRQRLQHQINAFEKRWSAVGMLGNFDGIHLVNELSEAEIETDADGEEESDGFEDIDDETGTKPEAVVLLLPSNLTPQDRQALGWEEMGKKEARLWVGQINDALQQLRIALGGKALTFREKVFPFFLSICFSNAFASRFEMQRVNRLQPGPGHKFTSWSHKSRLLLMTTTGQKLR